MKKRESKKDAFIPPLRVPEEFAERAYKAIEKLKHHLPHTRRMIWEAFIEIAERGEQLSWPPKFLTEKGYVHLSEALKLNGIADPTAFYDGCAAALIEAARKGHTIEWPPSFRLRVATAGG